MRIAHARRLIKDSVGDGYICLSINTYKLENDNDETAVIGCLMEIHGQSGPVVDWWGIFNNKDDFYEELNKCNIVILSKSEMIEDERLISRWKKMSAFENKNRINQLKSEMKEFYLTVVNG